MAKSEKQKTQRKKSHPESGLYFLLNEVQTPPQLSSAVAEGPGRRWDKSGGSVKARPKSYSRLWGQLWVILGV